MNYMDLILIFFSGIFTALGPCVLSILPISLAYTFSISNNKIDGFFVSLFFVLGFAAMFSILGVVFALFGNLFGLYKIKYFAGILAICFGVLLFFNYNISIKKGNSRLWNKIYNILKRNEYKYLGSFIFGFFYGVLTNTCADPILITILSYVSTKQDIYFGFIALFLYALGFGLPIILINLLGVEIKEIIYKFNPNIINKISGFILILLGIYILI